ncbi:hypothetical protein [Micromonospora avicenniae]|uniref:hypothetical protein n=1 Tax=Micromonospora avicenniae TaxID=1198245 RepID=UPI0033262DED
MIIPTLDGFVAGEKVAAAKLTSHTKGAIEAAVYFKPFCHLTNNAAQGFASGATVKHTLNQVVSDNDGMADTANSQVVIRTAGRYRVTFGNAWEASTTATPGVRAVFLHTSDTGNPVAAQAFGAVANAQTRCNASFTLYCDAGDRLEIRGSQTAGALLNTRTDYGGCFLMVEWVSLA